MWATPFDYLHHLVTVPAAAGDTPTLSQLDPAVMFQQIIHDGLVGDSFLRNFAVTYDIANARMIFT